MLPAVVLLDDSANSAHVQYTQTLITQIQEEDALIDTNQEAIS